eukprot:CAMPEP_0183298876 /NCGR_PEP_ID=MMETSP0160_2-20130417/5756_1 /TAXON_ID=2839 ORGANISM="Odontella Sinensis, Strain Grunow 1884" /NCGR_SAMPLE_ID=MMETSP0160_2 /ASSEMBLY_ACC=CAM_ASM_000250 /LENGTH=224 /DNA_ID=CAMNT_0025460997 /DNA_START=67 /DNA_END=741 /DNA_ORIENTATION=-
MTDPRGKVLLLLFLVSTYFSDGARVAAQGTSKHDESCPPVTTAPDFDLELYTSKRWFVHQQAPTQYVPVERNFCVYADYDVLEKKTFPWGYEVSVFNHAENKEGEEFGGPLCAFADDSNNLAKLKVAPCFLPKYLAGPYWVLAYDEKKGYALVSGGQPTIRREGGCTTGEGINDSGLWIFLRTQERNEALIKEARAVAKKFDIDLSVLNDVDHTNCNHNIESNT